MKKSIILKASLLMGVVAAFSSCKEEKIVGVDPNMIPHASDYAIKVEVDQEINQYTISLTDLTGNPAVGVYPVWAIYTKANPVRSTRPVVQDIVALAGDYDVEVKVGNHHGVSDGVQTATIHIENTIVDFGPYMSPLTEGGTKSWRIASHEQGHLGCGSPGTDGLDWWSAAPNDKAAWGVYENRMRFTDNGGSDTGLYTYDPGASGTIYVNTGITNLPPYSDYNTNDGQDYCAPAPLQENVPFTFSVEGTDFYLSMPAGTLVPYLPNVELYNEPKFKINSINRNKIELTCDNGGIAWHYIICPEDYDDDSVFKGFKYDSEFNLWKDAPIVLNSTFFAGGDDWHGVETPEIELSNERLFLHTPEDMGYQQWQGQVAIRTGLTLSSDVSYDFSMWLNAPVDSRVTVKLTHVDNDAVFISDGQKAFSAGGSCYYFSDVQGFDGELMVVFDFGGYPDTDFEITNIVLKDHANDDGTKLPSDDPVSWVDVDSEDNLMTTCNYYLTYWYAPNWAQIDDPETVIDGNSFTLDLPYATSEQWQAQFAIHTDIKTSADKHYDFRMTIASNKDIKGVTFKVTEDGDDNKFYMSDQVPAIAYDEVTYQWVNMPGIDIDPVNIFFDFGGNPDGTVVTVKDIIFQEHRE